ncbi:myc target protein 1 isoform X1 [Pyrgilauda ruficollis]|uniref:myc target protein 1 isoform X1 n=1 Tax=Pyrgilauda ruficollis TaxID=221976 RepID=UPI001B8790C3|nr:myc target protein 1 isoform X1 [Pyrgilauda ruficollis]
MLWIGTVLLLQSHGRQSFGLCLGRADLYATFQLDLLCTWWYCLLEWLCPFASKIIYCLLKEQITIAFTVSMVIGLVIGGIIWAFFTCLSRRRASAHISQGSPSSFSRRSRPSSHGHTAGRTGFYRNSSCERRSNLSLASLTFQRQASLEQANSFPRKSSFRASTFHPFLQCPPLPVETNSQLITLTPTNTTTTLVGSTTNSLSRPEFHWSNNNLRICHTTQTPPPAYETIIKAFPES